MITHRPCCYISSCHPGNHFNINTLRPSQNGRHFADAIFECIFVNENVWILIEISLKFVPKGPINNIPSLVQIMVWHRPGAKPLSEPMMVSLLTHICVTRPQWVKMTFYLCKNSACGDKAIISSWYWNRFCVSELNYELSHLSRDKIDTILQTFSNGYPWLKSVVFWFKLLWN